MNARLQAEISTLRSSPLFQLSLGSKELFHSNFLAWLFDLYPRESGAVLSRFLKKSSGDTAITRIFREQKNRDLTIHFKNGQVLVIENKVKSLPYIEQLERYSEDAEPNQNFVLLSLIPPPFSHNGVITVGRVAWHVLTYADLSVLIGDIGTRVHDEYHRSILVDYQAFITSFSAIFTLSLENTSGLFSDLYAPSKGSTLELLQPLRIGDLYQKLQYESFARKVYQTLVEHYGDTVSFLEAEEERQVRHIYVSHGMTRAMGMVSISYVLAEGLYLTVQIQGNSYRHMVQGYAGYGKESRVVAERLKAKGLWFRLSRVCEPSKEYPRGEKEFNTYSDIDFYRSGKVSPKATVEQVIEFVIHDMEQIAKQIRAISAALEV